MRALVLLVFVSCAADSHRPPPPDDDVLIERTRRRVRAQYEIFPPCVGPEIDTARHVDSLGDAGLATGAAVVVRGPLTLSDGWCTLLLCFEPPLTPPSRAAVERFVRGPCCNSCTSAARLGALRVAVRDLPLRVEALDCAMPQIRDDLAQVEVVVWGALHTLPSSDGSRQLLLETDRICALPIPPLSAPPALPTAAEFSSLPAGVLAVATELKGSTRGETFLANAIPALARNRDHNALLTATQKLLEWYPASPHAPMARFWRDTAAQRLQHHP
jgi:hypothetical protein